MYKIYVLQYIDLNKIYKTTKVSVSLGHGGPLSYFFLKNEFSTKNWAGGDQHNMTTYIQRLFFCTWSA